MPTFRKESPWRTGRIFRNVRGDTDLFLKMKVFVRNLQINRPVFSRLGVENLRLRLIAGGAFSQVLRPS